VDGAQLGQVKAHLRLGKPCVVKDLGNPLAPELAASVRPLYLGHGASYTPLGVVNGILYLLTPIAMRRAAALGSIAGPFGRDDRPEIFYTFTSPLYRSTVFSFDLDTGVTRPFEPPMLTFDPTRYRTQRVFVISKDGTRVPVFISHHKDLKQDGANAAMLYGFGGFGLSEASTHLRGHQHDRRQRRGRVTQCGKRLHDLSVGGKTDQRRLT
jgi:hypothetical protein